MSDEKTKKRSGTGELRGLLLALGAVCLAAAGYVLAHPADEHYIPRWSPLIAGYTVFGWSICGVSTVLALVLVAIAISGGRDAMIRRLRKFALALAASAICLVVLNILISNFVPIDMMENPEAAVMLGKKGSYFVTDDEFGVRYSPDWKVDDVMGPKYYSEIINYRQIVPPNGVQEYENGREYLRRLDRNGFVNLEDMTQCDIFVTGDSYVSPSISCDGFWTTFLAQQTGRSVYNAGVGSYAFQQELMVIKRYAEPMKPTTVIMGYFQGNDLWDAERFNDYQRSGLTWCEYINDIYDVHRPFPYELALMRLMLVLARKATEEVPEYQPPCDLVVNDKVKTFAFHKLYLQRVALAPQKVSHSRGWEVCLDSLRAARAECDRIGARFVVVYFPAKITVLLDQITDEKYWSELYESMQSEAESVGAASGRELRELLGRNHDVQYRLLKDFCAAEGIELLDTTQALIAAAQQGRWPYFSYDTHLNTEGNRVVAEALAGYFATKPADDPADD